MIVGGVGVFFFRPCPSYLYPFLLSIRIQMHIFMSKLLCLPFGKFLFPIGQKVESEREGRGNYFLWCDRKLNGSRS